MKDQKTSNTAERLAEIMEERKIKQVDIVRLCEDISKVTGEKVDKSHVSQWLHGVNEPSQRKLTTLALALDVSEPWLMGYDVKKERGPYVNYVPMITPAAQSDAHSLLQVGIGHLNEEEAERLLIIAKNAFPGKFEWGEWDD